MDWRLLVEERIANIGLLEHGIFFGMDSLISMGLPRLVQSIVENSVWSHNVCKKKKKKKVFKETIPQELTCAGSDLFKPLFNKLIEMS